MENYFIIEPEVPGELSGDAAVVPCTPPRVSNLHVTLKGWLGDQLMTCHPVFFVTPALKDIIERSGLTGVSFEPLSFDFDEDYPSDSARPDSLWALNVEYAAPGSCDFVVDERATLIATARAADLLRPLVPALCTVTPL